MLAALDRIDHLIRNALGRSVFGYPYAADLSDNGTGDFSGGGGPASAAFAKLWIFPFTSDDCIAALTMVVVFLLLFLVLLVVKLLLGMVLLRYARDRYARMKVKEHAIAAGQAERESFDAKGKRTGGYGQVEVGEERRRWIFGEDVEGLRKAREKERKAEGNVERDKEKDFGRVMRYEMVARRIW
jgi:ABC-type siderophore export system fused ATPase/permease subunit